MKVFLCLREKTGLRREVQTGWKELLLFVDFAEVIQSLEDSLIAFNAAS